LLTDPDSHLKQARFASLTFTSQKNRVRGEVIGLACSGDAVMCPVKAIVCRVLYLRQNGALPTTPLAHVYNSTGLVTVAAITNCIRTAVSDLGPTLGFIMRRICKMSTSSRSNSIPPSTSRHRHHQTNWPLEI
jgi:hypothetical protein